MKYLIGAVFGAACLAILAGMYIATQLNSAHP